MSITCNPSDVSIRVPLSLLGSAAPGEHYISDPNNGACRGEEEDGEDGTFVVFDFPLLYCYTNITVRSLRMAVLNKFATHANCEEGGGGVVVGGIFVVE